MVATARRTGGGSPEDEFLQILGKYAENTPLRVLEARTSISRSTLHRVFTGQILPSRESMEELLRVLRVPPSEAEQIRKGLEKARHARAARHASAAQPPGRDEQAAPNPPGALVINGDGSTIYVSTAAGSGGGSPSHEPPVLIPDMDGHALKPDPLKATTFHELTELMQEFRAWAGHPSCRDLAKRSGGAFSHATISNLLSSQPGRKPPLKLGYLQGFIYACGGDEDDLKRWITAWRRIDQGKVTPHTRHTSNVIAIKPPAEPAS